MLTRGENSLKRTKVLIFLAIFICGISAILLSLAGDTHAYSCQLNLPPPGQVTMMVDAYEYYACSELLTLTPPGYLYATFSNVDPDAGYSVANGGYGAFCSDFEGYILDNPMFGDVTYQVQLLSSIDYPTFRDRPWNKINYILNNTSQYNWLDVQAAIWTLIYGCTPSHPPLFDCPQGDRTAPCYFPFGGTSCSSSGCPPNGIVNIDNVTTIVDDANAHGGDFIPGNGDLFAIIIDPLTCTGSNSSYNSYCSDLNHLPFQLLFTTTTCVASYTITASAGPNGSITPSGDVTVDHGADQSFTIMPDANYHAEMSGTCGGNLDGNTYTTNPITADCTVIANFAINTYTLTYYAGPNGSISGTTPQTVSHGGSGTAVTAVAAPGYHFVQWSDSSIANPRTDTNVTAGITVTASFAINTYTLTYNAGPNGSISGTTPQTVSHGGSGTAVTAVANPGYHFVQWSDSSTANPRTDTNVTANITVTASFAISPVTPVRIDPTTLHSAIQAAFSDLLALTNGGTIRAWDYDFTENPTFNRVGILATFKGGYDTNFSNNQGRYTRIHGLLTIQSGTLVVENITIQGM